MNFFSFINISICKIIKIPLFVYCILHSNFCFSYIGELGVQIKSSKYLGEVVIFSPLDSKVIFFDNIGHKYKYLNSINGFYKVNFIKNRNLNTVEKQLVKLLKDKNILSIVGTDFIYSDLFFKYSRKFPKTFFLIKDTFKRRPNLNNYHIDHFIATYLISSYQFQKYQNTNTLIIADNNSQSNNQAINSIAYSFNKYIDNKNLHLYFLNSKNTDYNLKKINYLLKTNFYKTIFLISFQKKIFEVVKDSNIDYFSVMNPNFNVLSKSNIAKVKINYRNFFSKFFDKIYYKKAFSQKNIHIGLSDYENSVKIILNELPQPHRELTTIAVYDKINNLNTINKNDLLFRDYKNVRFGINLDKIIKRKNKLSNDKLMFSRLLKSIEREIEVFNNMPQVVKVIK